MTRKVTTFIVFFRDQLLIKVNFVDVNETLVAAKPKDTK